MSAPRTSAPSAADVWLVDLTRVDAHEALRRVAGGPVTPDARGRPVVGDDTVRVSLSHSGTLGAVARSDVPVGVDVERLRDDRDRLRVARRLTPSEQAFVGDDQGRFLAVWTAKEAVLKARGTGLAGGLDSVALAIAPDGTLTLDGWTLRALPTPPGWHGAVAVKAPGATVRVHAALP